MHITLFVIEEKQMGVTTMNIPSEDTTSLPLVARTDYSHYDQLLAL